MSLKPASPLKYNHTLGGGTWTESTEVDVDGYYYACGEKVSIFLMIKTDSTCTLTTSSILNLYFDLHPALTPKGVLNNCASNAIDSNGVCANSATTQVASPVGGSGLTLQLQKINKNAVIIVRVDLGITCGASLTAGSALTLTG